MGRVVLLVSRKEVLYQAHNILQEKKYAVSDMRMIQTENAMTEVRSVIAAGAAIIITRGLQVFIIKQYTDIPVVEIVVTARGMAFLVVKTRQVVGKTRPAIAIVSVKSMFYDMAHFKTIYDIRLHTYPASNGAGLGEQAKPVMEEGADLVIGGDVTVATAKKAGFSSLFLSIAENSLYMVFAMMESMGFIIGAKKRSNAQIEAFLDYSFNGVMGMDRNSIIATVSPAMRDILGPEDEQIIGRRIEQVFQDIDQGKLARILEGRDESYSSFMQISDTPVSAILVPVRMGDEVGGTILTCHKVERQRSVKERDHADGNHLKHYDLIARSSFSSPIQNSRSVQGCIRLVRLYSQFQQPASILGETGSELRLMVESMYNAGLYSDGVPFSLTCNGLSGGEQYDMIFGDKGAVFLINEGTIYIEDVGHPSPSSQYGPYQLIRYKTRSSRDVTGTVYFHIRTMVSSTLPCTGLWETVGDGRFGRDLFYLLSGLKLQVSPFRERPEDLEQLIEDLLKEFYDQCPKHHMLTEGARQCLKKYGWPGNRIQPDLYMNRLVLTAGRRNIDEILVRAMLEELYLPKGISSPGEYEKEDRPAGFIKPAQSGEERQIRAVSTECSRNRERTAKSLKINRATLWRKMKKCNIE